MACKDYPTVVSCGLVDQRSCAFEIHAVNVKCGNLRKVAERRVVRGFGPAASAHNESFRNEWDVAPGVSASANEGLSARVRVCCGSYSEQVFDLCACIIKFFSYFFEGVIFERIVAGETEVAGARVSYGMVSDFMAVPDGASPGAEAFFYAPGIDVKGGLYVVFVEDVEAIVSLAVAGVVECEADCRSPVVRPLKVFDGGELVPSTCKPAIVGVTTHDRKGGLT